MRASTTFTDSLTVLPASSSSDSSNSKVSGKADIFLAQSVWIPYGARGVFGGQVIAQALVAASKTVKLPLGLHSQHCYFLLPALGEPTIEYHVERIRDGKSYANRLVKAIQNGKVVFILAASYTLPPILLPKLETGSTPMSFQPYMPDQKKEAVSHSLRFAIDSSESGSKGGEKQEKGKEWNKWQDREEDLPDTRDVHPVPTGVENGWKDGQEDQGGRRKHVFQQRSQLPFPEDVLPPDDCQEEEDRWKTYIQEASDSTSERRRKIIEEYIQERKQSPVSVSAARFRGKEISDGFSSKNVRMTWLRPRLLPDEKPDAELMKAMIAYVTDLQFIGTAAQSVGLTWTSTPRLGMLASLDHSTHFYPLPEDFRPGDPMLHVMESVAADVGAGRGLVRGTLFDKNGRLLAATLQEGVVRANFGRGAKL